MDSESDNEEEVVDFRLQLWVGHPLHPEHPLTFVNSNDTIQRHLMVSIHQLTNLTVRQTMFRSAGIFHCDGCGVPSFGLSYHCLPCHFSLEAECANMPVITVKSHPHPLLLIQKNSKHKQLVCDSCDEEIVDPTFVRCVECDGFLHFKCSLSLTLRYNHHIHPLVLTGPSSTAERDSESHCCDVCQKERNMSSWVYCCTECNYVADIGCVIYECEVVDSISEISLENQLRSLELTGTTEAETKPAETLVQLYDSLTESEVKEYQGFIGAVMKELSSEGDDNDSTETDNGRESNSFSYLDKPLLRLLAELELEPNTGQNPFKDLDSESPAVYVGQYLATQKTAPILKTIFSKHGDITAKSSFSTKVKTLILNLFGCIVYNMCNTEVVNVTENLLVTWMFTIQRIQLAGFQVQFALDHWKRVALAFFGMQGRYITDNVLAELDQEMEEISLKLKEVYETRERHIELAEECLREAEALEGKCAGEGLI